MKRLNREQFWEQAKKEEELRKEEERKKALDARLRFEQERMEQERLEQEERERRYREREEQIEEHRHGGRDLGWIWGGRVGVGPRRGRGRVAVAALSPIPVPPGRRKQQSMEAEEARQRLKEQSIFVSASVGTGMGALGVAVPEVAVTGAFRRRGSSKRRTTGSSCGNRSRRWRRPLPSSPSDPTTPGTSSSSRSGWHRAAATPSHRAATGQVRGWGGGHGGGHHGAGECGATGVPAARRVTEGWGVPSAVPLAVGLGSGGIAALILLSTATAPQVASRLLAPPGGCCNKRGGSSLIPLAAGCPLPTRLLAHGVAAWAGCGGSLGTRRWLGKEALRATKGSGGAGAGGQQWGAWCAPGWVCVGHPMCPVVLCPPQGPRCQDECVQRGRAPLFGVWVLPAGPGRGAGPTEGSPWGGGGWQGVPHGVRAAPRCGVQPWGSACGFRAGAGCSWGGCRRLWGHAVGLCCGSGCAVGLCCGAVPWGCAVCSCHGAVPWSHVRTVGSCCGVLLWAVLWGRAGPERTEGPRVLWLCPGLSPHLAT
uniref:Uncharacterized protein n=1 Tax=Anas platyrhynchos platyrhynchos TaxID=8840 RepID=A0A493TL08_ANAPP